ncbi:ubiquinol-cytochrome C chaperone family protein [Stakelama marina]|uniref:Ubiquinol-cytochrome C chaperone n=1 Tax=Stakelama marina TaxID=2826939 RepID=A0A8T4IE77_9SPHN|nr:ubiquinol-cytochrome C chaperone family protein [Stakelama marina]MBR0553318.1 ubiquinol-cytochrome C chaperone [Stakelama marina]
MGFLDRLFGRVPPRETSALYNAVVERARQPHWYVEGGVADTIDGRFDMIAAVLSMVLLRLEADPQGTAPGASLAECFIDDMDGQLRQIGFGDIVIGKHVGRMMGMLGGRLGAYREGVKEGDLKPALIRNLYRGEDPGSAPAGHVEQRLMALREALAATELDSLLAGNLP